MFLVRSSLQKFFVEMPPLIKLSFGLYLTVFAYVAYLWPTDSFSAGIILFLIFVIVVAKPVFFDALGHPDPEASAAKYCFLRYAHIHLKSSPKHYYGLILFVVAVGGVTIWYKLGAAPIQPGLYPINRLSS